jgi:hypothetical protein
VRDQAIQTPRLLLGFGPPKDPELARSSRPLSILRSTARPSVVPRPADHVVPTARLGELHQFDDSFRRLDTGH